MSAAMLMTPHLACLRLILPDSQSTEYKDIAKAKYMLHNKPKLNDEKTHLLVLGPNNCQTADQVRMITPTDIIKPTSFEKLLGCYISKDMSWAEYIKVNKKSLMKAFHLRLRAIKKIRYFTTFKDRKIIAEVIFMSKLCYLITL